VNGNAVAESEPCAQRKILVADDNDDAAESLAMLLRTLGHDAVTANDGIEALEYAQNGGFDLALLDIGMPRLNGYELASRIREQPWGRTVHLVALTGWGQESDKRRALESGFNDHLTKPVDPEHLIEILARPRQLHAV
jgi:CheY-like chemotaxis protein